LRDFKNKERGRIRAPFFVKQDVGTAPANGAAMGNLVATKFHCGLSGHGVTGSSVSRASLRYRPIIFESLPIFFILCCLWANLFNMGAATSLLKADEWTLQWPHASRPRSGT
jgi:hypothetical protein